MNYPMKTWFFLLALLYLLTASTASAFRTPKSEPLSPALTPAASVATLAQLDEIDYSATVRACSFECDGDHPYDENAWDLCVDRCVYDSGL